MDQWTVIHDAVFAVVPPLEIPLPLLGVFVLLVVVVGFEIRSWRPDRAGGGGMRDGLKIDMTITRPDGVRESNNGTYVEDLAAVGEFFSDLARAIRLGDQGADYQVARVEMTVELPPRKPA